MPACVPVHFRDLAVPTLASPRGLGVHAVPLATLGGAASAGVGEERGLAQGAPVELLRGTCPTVTGGPGYPQQRHRSPKVPSDLVPRLQAGSVSPERLLR